MKKLVILILFVLTSFTGCFMEDTRDNPFDPESSNYITAAPEFSITGGTFTSAQTVTLTSSTPGASIKYTTDGNNPSRYYGTDYTGQIAINNTQTIRAISYVPSRSQNGDSAIKFEYYTITGTVANPQFSKSGGVYVGSQSVTITCATEGVVIKYTIDGTTPSRTNGITYSASAPLTVSSGLTTVKAYAYVEGWHTDSDAAVTAEYKVRNVYVAGHYMKVAAQQACYWKNGIKTDLSPDTTSHANSIYIDGNDIYIAGDENDGAYTRACYWKTDISGTTPVRFWLGNASGSSQVKSIYVSGTDIYAAGEQYYDSKTVACYWINNSTSIQYLSTIQSSATSIVFSNVDSKIYISGYEKPDLINFACYWSGTLSPLTKSVLENSSDSTANSLYLYENSIYITGSTDSPKYMTYWKNDSAHKTVSTMLNTIGNSIFVSGTDIYVAGYQAMGTTPASFWKNNTQSLLINGYSANSIYVYDGDTFIAGNTNSNACYWINGGTNINLPGSTGQANAIVVGE